MTTPTPDRLIAWRTLPFPVPWDEVFGSAGDLHLEIGFGDGRFTTRRASHRPHDRFVGLEISSGSLVRALRRIRREDATNVRLVKLGARFALRHLFAPASLADIVVNFPDPWPKERHARHRLLQASFFRLAASRLRVGGEIRLATDHADYLAFAREEAARSGLMTAEEREPPAAVFETKYALKWKAQGRPLHYVAFRYGGAPVEPHAPLERPTTMPHALFAGTLPDGAELSKRVIAYGDGHVILHEAAGVFGAAHGAGASRWLVRATVDEPDLKQQLLVLVHQRSLDEVIVRLESFGDPIVTPTARGAVHAVSEWLLDATELRLTQRNY